MNWLSAVTCWVATLAALGFGLAWLDAKYYRGPNNRGGS